MEKQYKVKFAISSTHSVGPLKLAYTNLWVSFPIFARNGIRYFMTLIDEFSRKVWVYFLREKLEAIMKFKV